MKKILFILLCVFTTQLFSQETYICSLDLSPYNQSGFEVKIYERTGDHFTKITSYGDRQYFNILEENDSFLTLVESTSDYQSVFVTFIDKKNNTFLEYYLCPEVTLSEEERSKKTGTFVRRRR